MSASAARRRKQLLQKKKSQESNGEDNSMIMRIESLLAQSEKSEDSAEAESIAYEALQLAQSSVRKCVKSNDGLKAFRVASSVIIPLLNRGYVAMASQLCVQMVDALFETHTAVCDEVLKGLKEIDSNFQNALGKITCASEEEEQEKVRLQKLHLQFLRKIVKYSDDLGTVRFGDMALHSLLARGAWDMEERADAVMHFALAEEPETIVDKLMTLPPKTEYVAGTPAAERDVLLTRGVLLFLAVENLRDANLLLQTFIAKDSERDAAQLAKSYMAKDGKKPTHVTFCCALIRICETEAAPLFSWLVRSFQSELGRYPELQGYTTKIGRVYFNIQPPPSMMSMMENMMTAMNPGAMMGGM